MREGQERGESGANKVICASAFVVPPAHKVVVVVLVVVVSYGSSPVGRQQTLLFAKFSFFSLAVFCAISLSSFAELRKTFHFDSTLLYF